MARKIMVQRKDESSPAVLTQILAEDEAQLQEIVKQNPNLLPVDASSKSREIWNRLDLMQLRPDWCLPSMLEENPLAWIVEVNGLPVDVRAMPREIQEEAYRLGLIPYVP